MGRPTRAIFLLGACGAALFFGDAMITPAISVLSAIEGLKLVEPLSEGFAIARILQRLVERGLRPAERAGTDVEPAAVEPGHRDLEADALVAEPVGDRHTRVLENHGPGRLGVPAHLLLVLAILDAGGIRRHGAIAQALLEELKQPLLGTTLILPDSEEPLNDPEEIRDALQKRIELVVDGGGCSLLPTTVVDLTSDTPVVLREGRGDVSLFA